ncbi:MAG: hypothetical protein ABI772_05940 [Bacteroidota bacterium]
MSLLDKLINNKQESAKVIDRKPEWSTGATLPQVFSNSQNTYLIYLINEVDPDWDGTNPKGVDNTSNKQYHLALVEFDGNDFKFGIANDEVHHGLPLWSKGLKHYCAHLIENSLWIEEKKKINKVHRMYNEDNYKGLQHLLFLFHDELFEIITDKYHIETFRTTFKDLAMEVARRMNSR